MVSIIQFYHCQSRISLVFLKVIGSLCSFLKVSAKYSSQSNYSFSLLSFPFLSFPSCLAKPMACKSSQASDQTHAIAVTRAMAVTALNPLSHQGTPKKSFYKKYFIVCSLLFWSEINRGQNYKWCNFKN